MDRYTINTYAAAVARIQAADYLYDTGQIAPPVVTQLYLSMRTGAVKCSRDTWPIRGLPHDGRCPIRTVWELAQVEEMV